MTGSVNTPVEPAGKPVTLRFTGLLNPPEPVIDTENEKFEPGAPGGAVPRDKAKSAATFLNCDAVNPWVINNARADAWYCPQ